MITEDNKVSRVAVRDMLQFKDYQTLEAPSAEQGIGVVRKKKPALILTDFHLRKMSGFEARSDLIGLILSVRPGSDSYNNATGHQILRHPNRTYSSYDLRSRYHGCGCPGTFMRSVYTDVCAQQNNVRKSAPPNAKFTACSGKLMMPTRLPSGVNTQMPPGPVQ